jgi:hypothetical protein
MLHFRLWAASFPIAILVAGLMYYRMLRGRTQIRVHRDDSADAVASLQRSRFVDVHQIAELATALIFAGLLIALQDPKAIFSERRTEAIVFIDPGFMGNPRMRKDVAAGVTLLAAREPALRIGLMTKGPLQSPNWLSPQQAAKGEISGAEGAPANQSFDQAPGSLIEAALASMSSWRTRRFLLVVAGPDASAEDLGYRRQELQTLHLRGITLIVGGAPQGNFDFASLGTAIFTGRWNVITVRDAFDEFASEIDHASIELHTPIIAYCLLLIFAHLAASSSAEQMLFEYATARIGRRILADKLTLRHPT